MTGPIDPFLNICNETDDFFILEGNSIEKFVGSSDLTIDGNGQIISGRP